MPDLQLKQETGKVLVQCGHDFPGFNIPPFDTFRRIQRQQHEPVQFHGQKPRRRPLGGKMMEAIKMTAERGIQNGRGGWLDVHR